MRYDHARIEGDVACLDTDRLAATLLSTAGFNCVVWKAAGHLLQSRRVVTLDMVVKCHRDTCSMARIRAYARDYRRLRAALGEMVPQAVFIASLVNARPSVVVLASAREPWFDLANPAHEEEARPLFERLKRARDQLAQFVRAAREWQSEGRLIDLFGRDNLVLDRNFDVAYLDSFGVFFHTDLLYAIHAVDDEIQGRIEVSARRLDYLESLL